MDTTLESPQRLCDICAMHCILTNFVYKPSSIRFFSTLSISLAWFLSSATTYAANVQTLEVPTGFNIEILNFSVPKARQMALTSRGTLIIGTRREGKVYAIPNALTSAAPRVITLMEGLNMPSGVAVYEGSLYIGAVNQIIRVPDIDDHLVAQPPSTVLTDRLPQASHHGWKYLKFGPDGALYVPVGAPCNICLSDDARFASLLRMDTETGATQIWAEGIRNTVGFDWHPSDGQLWFSDNGRDMLGDDLPAEEINVISQPGEHFGYPFLHATHTRDPEFGTHDRANISSFTSPVLEIQAHSAPLGMAFYEGTAFPESYRHTLFIAEHGSWNRSTKVGYQVSKVRRDSRGQLSYEPFVTGWLINDEAWGRPNDVMVVPDGSVLISDDDQGVVYRVTYEQISD